jgi:hypothetical protein
MKKFLAKVYIWVKSVVATLKYRLMSNEAKIQKLSNQSDKVRKEFLEVLIKYPLNLMLVESRDNEIVFCLGGYKFVFYWQVFSSFDTCVFGTNEIIRNEPITEEKIYQLIFSTTLYDDNVCFSVNGEWLPINNLLTTYMKRLHKYIFDKEPTKDISALLNNLPKHPKAI